jgi:hypothetical protein
LPGQRSLRWRQPEITACSTNRFPVFTGVRRESGEPLHFSRTLDSTSRELNARLVLLSFCEHVAVGKRRKRAWPEGCSSPKTLRLEN